MRITALILGILAAPLDVIGALLAFLGRARRVKAGPPVVVG